MNYTIKKVSEITNLPIPTLRYYDKEGLLPDLRRKESGYRMFSENDLETIRTIECFKRSGLQIKEMKYFMSLSEQGDASLQERYEIYQNQVKRIEERIADMESTLKMAKAKLAYYEAAVEAGSEAAVYDLYKKYQEEYHSGNFIEILSPKSNK